MHKFIFVVQLLFWCSSASSQVTVKFSDNESSFNVSYDFAHSCEKVGFKDKRYYVQHEFRKNWELIDGCFEIKNNELIRTKNTCNHVRFKVNPDTKMIMQHYSQLFSLSGNGVYFYPTYFFLDKDCGAVSTVVAPRKDGFIVSGVQSLKVNQELKSSQESEELEGHIIIAKNNTKVTEGNLFLDEKLPSWFVDSLDPFVNRVVSWLKNKAGAEFRTPPMAISNTITDDGFFNIHASVSHPKVIRVTLYNLSTTESKTHRDLFLHTFAHEAAHVLQPNKFNPLLSEGGAEYLSYYILYELGVLNEAFIVSALNQSILHCLKAYPQKANHEQTIQSIDPYACGHVFHALLANSFLQKGLDPVQEILAFYKNVDKSKEPIDHLDFLKSHPTWWSTLQLFATEQTLSQHLERVFELKDTEVQIIDKSLTEYTKVIFNSDCAGADFYFDGHKNTVTIGGHAECRTIPKGFVLKYIQGKTLDTLYSSIEQDIDSACKKAGLSYLMLPKKNCN